MRKIGYRTLRLIHLYAGLVILSFLLMYAITGIRFFYEEYFTDEWTEWKSKQEIKKTPLTTSLNDYAYQLKKDYNIKGRVKEPTVDKKNQTASFSFENATKQVTVVVPLKKDSIKVHERTNTTVRHKMNHIHVMRGYWGGFWYTIWGIFVDLTAAAMLLFIITGLFMWYRSHRKDPLGWILLIFGLLITFGQIIYFML